MVAFVCTLIIGSLALTLVSIAKSDAGFGAVLNLKGASVKAITNGQGTLIGLLVTNDADSAAICHSIPGCKLPPQPPLLLPQPHRTRG